MSVKLTKHEVVCRAVARGKSLRRANLSHADLSRANLTGADLSRADLSRANLSYADLTYADLTGANLTGANLSRANLSYADLTGADLTGANLSGADLWRANLSGADLWRANLSHATGLLSASQWLTDNFERDDLGVIVYKRQNGTTAFAAPVSWTYEPGAYLTEVCNPLPTIECGCGVNFGTRDWCDNNYESAPLWRCRIRWIDLAGVVVPYHTDGKARCARLELLERVS